jgi:PPOX class probable F420-dependent enzyme
VFSTIGNVSRETAEAERKLAAEVEKRTDENDKASEEEEHAADFAERLHKKIVEEKEKRSTYWEPCRLRKELDRGRERMGIALVDDVKRLLDSRNFVHLATVMSDGSPHSAVVWAGREGDRILVCTEEGSVKARNTLRDPRVAISVFDLDDPYRQAQLRGRVVERRRDTDFKDTDAISKKYVGKPYPYRTEVPIMLVIEIEKARYSKEPFEHEKAKSA